MNSLANTFLSSKIIYSGLTFVVAVASGVILSSLGRPLNSAVFGLHKIIAVATIILLGLGLRTMLKSVDVKALCLVFIAISGLLFLGLVVSGALMSFERPFPAIILQIHSVLPFLTLAASAMSVYLLVGSRS